MALHTQNWLFCPATDEQIFMFYSKWALIISHPYRSVLFQIYKIRNSWNGQAMNGTARITSHLKNRPTADFLGIFISYFQWITYARSQCSLFILSFLFAYISWQYSMCGNSLTSLLCIWFSFGLSCKRIKPRTKNSNSTRRDFFYDQNYF